MSNDQMVSEDSIGDIVSPGDVIAGKYRVDRLIGTGGMGIVVEAYHLHFEERVAIKFLVPQLATAESLTRFEREARAAFKIKSEHVARVIDVGKLDGNVPYMVMEFLEGTDLGVMLTDRRAFAIDDAVEYVLQALEAVAEAHVLGIVHRDLKPENLFLTKRTDGTPCVKVLDFGLSKATNDTKGERQRALTGTAQVMGTPQYMSPEQWMSARDVGTATDQWALGVILYELVTGHQPFDQEQLAQLCTQVLRGEPEPVLKLRPDAPPGLVQIINRCLRKEPKQRFPNVGEMAVALLEYGPARARTTVKRIVGVFKTIGVDAGEVPASVRGGGGLGQGLVLGRPPPSERPSLPSQSQVDGMPPPPPSFPGLPRPNPPPARPSYASATPTTVTPSSGDPSSGDPSSGDLVATRVYHREPGTFDHLPDPTGGSEPELPVHEQRAPTSSRTAVLDGHFRAPVTMVDPGAQQQGGYAPPVTESGPQSVTAPSPVFPFYGSAPPASTSYPDGSFGDAPPQRRAVTAQSWQHMLDPALVARGNRERKMVFAVIAATLMFATLVIVLLVSGGSDDATPASDGVEDERPKRRQVEEDDTLDNQSDEPEDGVAPGPSGGPSGSASVPSPTSTAAFPTLAPRPSADAPKSAPAPKPQPQNPFRRERIFDKRN